LKADQAILYLQALKPNTFNPGSTCTTIESRF